MILVSVSQISLKENSIAQVVELFRSFRKQNVEGKLLFLAIGPGNVENLRGVLCFPLFFYSSAMGPNLFQSFKSATIMEVDLKAH